MTQPGNHKIDELLASYLLEETNADATAFVERWLMESAENRRYFEHLKTIWDASQSIASATDIDEKEAWKKFNQRIKVQSQLKSPRVFMPTWLKYAAAIFIAVLLITLSYSIFDGFYSTPVIVASKASAETKSLPDGSTITLNKNSSLTYTSRFVGDARKVGLKGEAFFNVKPNKTKPFIIDVNDVRVTVLGTSFNVKGYDGNTEVSVESGTVKVERGQRTILLRAGESVQVGKADTMINVEKTSGKLYNYYVSKEFVCDNTPLWKVVEVLNEAYNVNIVIENDDLRQLPLTTTFHNESLDNILKVISETFNITVSRQGNRITMK